MSFQVERSETRNPPQHGLSVKAVEISHRVLYSLNRPAGNRGGNFGNETNSFLEGDDNPLLDIRPQSQTHLVTASVG